MLAAGRRTVTILVLGVLPVVLVVAFLATNFHKATFLYDFHGGLYSAAHDILHGHNPYRAAYVAREAAVLRAGGTPQMIDVPVYPPLAFLAAVPFSLLPYKVAALLFSALSVAALGLALRLLEVRDWRCYGAAFLSWPVLSGLILGAVNPFLILAVAAAWRWRSRAVASGAALASVIAGKVFPWPLAAWLFVTKRFRAFGIAVALTVVGLLASWAVIGFHGMADYPRMLSNLSFVQRGIGVSPVAGLLAVGVPATVAQGAAVLMTGLLLVLAAAVAARPDGDRRALGLVVIAALTASPNVWPHYFALLFVPVALLSPGFSVLWLVPLLANLAPVDQPHGHVLLLIPYFVIEAVFVYRLVATGPLRLPTRAARRLTARLSTAS